MQIEKLVLNRRSTGTGNVADYEPDQDSGNLGCSHSSAIDYLGDLQQVMSVLVNQMYLAAFSGSKATWHGIISVVVNQL